MSSKPLEASAALLTEWLAALGTCSAPGQGVTRLAYDPAWCQGQRWLAGKAVELGLAATTDSAGNLYFHSPALQPGDYPRKVLLVGSHLDSVLHGGLYDGAYGSIAGLLLAAESRGNTDMPVVGFVTCEEEESRFRGGLMGARSMLGLVEYRELDSVSDAAGVTWRQALHQARVKQCAAPLGEGQRPFEPSFAPGAMLELHIEQGPVLETEMLSLGIVDSIAGYRRFRMTVIGEARHSGTTPMRLRRDALAAAAAMISTAEAYAGGMEAPAVATAGYVHAQPGLFNVVPGTCELWIEVRHVDHAILQEMAVEIGRRCRAIADARGVELEIEELSRQEPAALAPEMVSTAETLAQEMRIPFRRMSSGAAHDTMVFARAGVPSLLVFVPSRHGVSHSPEEFTSPEDLATGFRFMGELVARIAKRRA